MFKPKKSLGQNFLKSKKVLNKIIEASDLSSTDLILEIGPGKGSLTKELLSVVKKVVAIEKDHRAVKFLEENFAVQIAEGDLHLIHGDVLEFDPKELGGEYKLVANIPYYITGEILRKFLSSQNQPTQMVLLVQEEVAKRIVARDEKESILSISVKAYGEPKYIGTVSRKDFSPSPKVDSAILSIINISKKSFTGSGISEEKFFDVVRTGFKHKRKKVLKNLALKFDIGEMGKGPRFRKDDGTDKSIRAEDLKLEDWLEIVSKID